MLVLWFTWVLYYLGSDRPAFKYLNKYVVMEIAHRWHDVGTELLETGEEAKLRVMLDKYGSNSKEASKEMLLLWLDGHYASWNQLIEALKLTHIGLYNKGCKLEEMLSNGGMYVCMYACMNVYV